MNVLLFSPIFPKTFWSFERVLNLIGRKVLLPPLGLVTVAAMLPRHWSLRLVDRNVRAETEADWQWADLILISAMMVQKEDFLHLIGEGVRRGKKVAVGGPYPTSMPTDAERAGAHYLVLDEGELTIPMFIAALERGEQSGTFRAAEKPDITATPVPRFDLLELSAYDSMSVQFSRGCPFQCEFCDIIVLYGRKPRTKTPEQLLAELQALVDLGWDRSVFVVDDNFIGNQRNVKRMLKALIPWMQQRGFPFRFTTEASVNLAEDAELMELMVEAGFDSVFLGIETPDEESLNLTQKFQNNRKPLSESCRQITQAGLRLLAGFIIGFDGEKSGAGERIVRFVEQTAIPDAMFSMLQALPGTALWSRLEREDRLVDVGDGMNQSTLMNFVPTRPIDQIAEEYVQAFWELYEPARFIRRCYRHALELGMPKGKRPFKLPALPEMRGLLQIVWLQGVQRARTRRLFWAQLWDLLRRNPQALGAYLTVCAHGEHFFEFREEIRAKIHLQLAGSGLGAAIGETIATRSRPA
ncbi:B12-binding domain-containing radical SAM protein [Gloeobacter kilaueensis]|uniref:Radical SAM domain-containing protein n=1 Tax=Gloeobacter kilaueensis (strain ATCC BAA-2537 / CCAP 1431/1 / ULC 316 / JS1) TaxID=1183438 RepID=U5QEI2_GLOK1|nr:B12-binding domain-containing radical SAM protein [Gloeobacter kilaueensis]AGY57293.1 radical SAM domain-containing protein [Gloeobacter kilaueensis JS1]